MKEGMHMGKHILFVLGSITIVGILAVVLLFASIFMAVGSFSFSTDNDIRTTMMDMKNFLEYTLVDFDESELTGIENPKRNKLFHSQDKTEYGLSKTVQVPDIFIASIDGIKDHNIEQYRLMFSEAVVDDKNYIMAGRIMSYNGENAFQGYITEREHFFEKAPVWMASAVKKSPLETDMISHDNKKINFYLHDKISDKYILLHGNGENNPGLKTKKSRYFELRESFFPLVSDLEIVATYMNSFNREFKAGVSNLIFFEIAILLLMNFLYFKKVREGKKQRMDNL